MGAHFESTRTRVNHVQEGKQAANNSATIGGRNGHAHAIGDANGAGQATAVDRLTARLKSDRLTHMALQFLDRYEHSHLKDLVVDSMDDRRRMVIDGHETVNFGSDSFLGLDRDPRVQAALVESLDAWGLHNGASRAFASIELCEEAERRLADWLDVPSTLIYPSVTLANSGLLPAVVGAGDLLVLDRRSHDSMHQAAKIAVGNGARLVELNHGDAESLSRVLQDQSYKGLVVAVDGVYSMTGVVPPLAELDRVTREAGGILYVDDAHGTGVVGPGGRGAAYDRLGSLDNVLMVGSLSKAFSCLGAFVTCTPKLRRILKIRSSSFIFGGPVPPPYLAAVCAVCDLLQSSSGYSRLRQDLQQRLDLLTDGITAGDMRMLGGEAAIVSVVVGDIEKTFHAGRWLYDRGYYVQSATYPAVPITGGLLRIQVNANHELEDVRGLVEALAALKVEFQLPGPA